MAESNRDAPLCPCGFWGSTQTSGLCSKCYKEMLRKQECSGYPLQNPSNSSSSSTSVVTDSSKSQQLTQKMSENFDLIFSSNQHNNKPQDSANRNPSSLDVAANNDEVDLNNTIDADVITSEMPALVLPTTTATTISVTRAESTAALTSVNNNITTATTTSTTTTTTALSLPPPITIVAPTATTDQQNILQQNSESLIPNPTTTTDQQNILQQNSESLMAIPARTSVSLIGTAAQPNYALIPSSSSVPTITGYLDVTGKPSNTDTSTAITAQTSNTTDSNLLSRPAQRNRKRCFKCNCRLDLASSTIGLCKCDYVFCDLHRLPEQHDCTYDHKTEGRLDARNKMVSPKKHMGTTLKRLDS